MSGKLSAEELAVLLDELNTAKDAEIADLKKAVTNANLSWKVTMIEANLSWKGIVDELEVKVEQQQAEIARLRAALEILKES